MGKEFINLTTEEYEKYQSQYIDMSLEIDQLLHSLNNQLENLSEEEENLKLRKKKLQARITKIKKDIKTIEIQIYRNNQQINSLQNRLKQFNNYRTATEKAYSTGAIDNNTLKIVQQQITTQIKKNKGTILEIDDANVYLEGIITSKNSVLDELSKFLKDVNDRLKSNHTRQNNISKNIKICNNDKKNIQNKRNNADIAFENNSANTLFNKALFEPKIHNLRTNAGQKTKSKK